MTENKDIHAIDLEKLVAPEGSGFSLNDIPSLNNNDDTSKPPGTTDDLLKDVPRIDLENGNDLFSQNQFKENVGQSQNSGNYEQFIGIVKQTYGDDFIPSDIEDVSELFKAPEGGKAKIIEMIENKVANTLSTSVNHPLVSQLSQKIAETGNIDDALEQVYQDFRSNYPNLNNMSSKEIMEWNFRNKFPDQPIEKIRAAIDKMDEDILDLQAEGIKKDFASKRSEINEEYSRSLAKQREQDAIKIENERQRQLKDTYEKFKEVNSIYGLPLSESEKAEFINETLPKMLTPDESGNSVLFNLLNDNVMLAKVLFIATKGEPKLRQMISAAKEGTKRNYIDSLDKNPPVGNKGTASGREQEQTELNFDALIAPEHLTFNNK